MQITRRGLFLFATALLLALISVARASTVNRIVSLDLCTDWMLLQYARPDLQITYSPLLYRYPNHWLPAGKPVHNGTLEQILTLHPDLVLSGEFNASLLRKRLQQLGLTVKTLPLPQQLEGIRQLSQQFADSVPANRQLVQALSYKIHPAKGKSLLLLGANGVGTGRSTLENDIIGASGWRNYVSRNGFVRLDLERLVSQPPDAVLWSKATSASLANLFAQHTALADIIGEPSELAASWRWQCPGPWTFQLIDELAQWKDH